MTTDLFPAITAVHEKDRITLGRMRAAENRVRRSWKAFHIAWQRKNNFRPAATARDDAALCASSTSSIHAHVEREGGATSASASADSAVGARRLTPG